VCPANAIELGVFRKRLIEPPVGSGAAGQHHQSVGVRQKTDPAYGASAAPCATWFMNNAIAPMRADEGQAALSARLRQPAPGAGRPAHVLACC
jgi:glutamate synthase (NADPH/NADH) large chain